MDAKSGVAKIGEYADKALNVWVPKIIDTAQKSATAAAKGAKSKLKKLATMAGGLGQYRITSYNVCYTKLLRYWTLVSTNIAVRNIFALSNGPKKQNTSFPTAS